MAKSRESLTRERFNKFMKQAQEQPTKRKKRRARYYGKTRRGMGVAHNPPLLTDVLEYALPGFGGFAVTKFVANLASSQIAKRWPRLAKHAGAISSVGSFLGAWYFGHRIKMLARWHTPIVVGSAIASLQNIMQIYFPDKFSGLLLGSPKQNAIEAIVQQQQVLASQQQQLPEVPALPDHLEEINDDPSWYTYNDAYDAGRYNQGPAGNPQKAPPPPPVNDGSLETSMDDEDLAQGLFANNGMTASLEN